MEAQHTPGPWEAHQGVLADAPTVWDVTSRNNHRDYGATPKGWFVATIHEVNNAADAAANARLIAAAPELLALAHQYASDLRYPPTSDSKERRLAAIEAVLTKIGAAA